MPVRLSASEQAALQTLVNEGGSMLVTRISERNTGRTSGITTVAETAMDQSAILDH